MLEGNGGVIGKAAKMSVIQKLRKWLSEFWYWVKDSMTQWSKDEAARVSLDDFVNMPIADLAKGTRFSESQLNAEERSIVEKAKADGTYMKAPNGKPTNLNEKQWAQVRTKAFKDWFGDWEDTCRAELVRKLDAIDVSKYEITGTPKDMYLSLPKATNNNDGTVVQFDRDAFRKDFKQNGKFEKIIPALKDIFENSIPVIFENDKLAGTARMDGTIHKEHRSVKEYRQYVGKALINGTEEYVRYTVRIQKNQNGVHNVFVTDVDLYEKPFLDASLADSSVGARLVEGKVSDAKLENFFKRANNSSQVVDENGEPLVVDGLFLNLNSNPIRNQNKYLSEAKKLVEICKEAEQKSGQAYGTKAFFFSKEGDSFLERSMKYPDITCTLFDSIMEGKDPKLTVAYRYGEIRPSQKSYNYLDNKAEKGVSVVGRVIDLNTTKNPFYEDFWGGKNYNIVIGYDIGFRGADGELLLRPAQVIGRVDNIGGIAKSATSNNGEFSTEDNDIRFQIVTDKEQSDPVRFRERKSSAEETDAAYYEALAKKDRKAAQRIIDEQAEKMMPDSKVRNDEGEVIPPSERFNREDEDIRFRESVEHNAEDEISAVNNKFNEELSTLTQDNADKKIFYLGRPSAILRSAGVQDKMMKLYGNKILKKMRKHGFSLNEIQNLPIAVANPIAVFNNYGSEYNRSILTELKTANGNFLVTLDLGKGEDIDFNIVLSVFGKGDEKVFDWIEKGFATYINKEKALNYLHHSAPIAEALSNSRLSSVVKLVNEFENPKLEEETVSQNARLFHLKPVRIFRNVDIL